MPFFTLHRNFALRTTKGFTVNFVKGQPTWVPPMCVPDAVAIGAVSDETVDVLGEEEKPVVHLSPEERTQKLYEAFETLLARNQRGDFTASGLPHNRKIEELVNFDITNKERDTAWLAFTQARNSDE